MCPNDILRTESKRIAATPSSGMRDDGRSVSGIGFEPAPSPAF